MSKKQVILSVTVGMFLLFLVGCGTTAEEISENSSNKTPQYSVTIATTGEGVVDILPESTKKSYPAGTEITLITTPLNDAWVFYDDESYYEGNINSKTFLLTEDVVATLNFSFLT